MDELFDTPPLKNTGAMKCIAVLRVSPTTQSDDLTALFGAKANGPHRYFLIADGCKPYVAFGSAPGTIDEQAFGSASGVSSGVGTGLGPLACWPIPDGTVLPFRVTGGRETGTGVATYVHYNHLHYKVATGAATGFLRIYRALGQPGQDASEFGAP